MSHNRRLKRIEAALHTDADTLVLADGGRVQVSAWSHWDIVWAYAGLGHPPDVETVAAIARSRRRRQEGSHHAWAREAAELMLDPDWEPAVIGDYSEHTTPS